MSDLLREVREIGRVREIRGIAKDRNINFLCHFTRIENLISILSNGLRSRFQLRRAGIEFCPTDLNRIDGHQNTVSLSVSFPNYRMFYSKRDFFWKSEGMISARWVVLLLEADLLWELDCVFCQQNAAHSSVRDVPLEKRRRPQEFESFFYDFEEVCRLDLGIPRNYPTNPQAEVLAFGEVPMSYLREIHFFDTNAWENWPYKACTPNKAKVVCSDYYFNPREDYKVWQRLGS